jgi:FkbM family methyltransferase
LKKLIKKILSPIFHSIAVHLGYRKTEAFSEPILLPIDKNSKSNLLENFYKLLKSVNFIPKHIVDVGANHGSWTREALKYFPEAYYTLLDPQSQLKSSIKDILEVNDRVTFYPVGAGNITGALKFTLVDRDDSCTFILTEDEAKNSGYQQVEVQVVQLNQFLPTVSKIYPDIIKIDAEGFDLEVLEGATNYFGITEIFMVEAGVMAKNIKNSAVAVIQFMDEKGYKLLDITDMNRTIKYNALWLVELVFVKKDGRIDNLIETYNF